MSNSVIGSGGTACIGPLESGGNNFALASSCPQLGRADTLLETSSPPWVLRLLAHRRAVVPTPSSPVIDSRRVDSISNRATPACEATDQRGFLRDRQFTGACDAGAIELDALPPIDPAHVSGYWFDPGRDGIYVHANFLSPDLAYLLFQTFGSDGEPAWYYGTATPSGSQLIVSLYRNTGLAVQLGDVVGSVEAERVGEATFILESCQNASFVFSVDEREIGTGTLDLQRLTFTEGLGCIDRR